MNIRHISISSAGALCLLLLSGCHPWGAPERVDKYTDVDEALKNNDAAVYVNLYDQQLEQFPEGLTRLQNLTRLGLRRNRFSVPDEIRGLTKLKILDLGECKLDALPDGLGALGELETLYLNDNSISNFPTQITRNAKLTYVNLDRNALTSIPPEIASLTALKWLRLNYNKISELPAEIGKLGNLRRLYLQKNGLTAIPASISGLTALTDLNVRENQLTALPAEIGQLKSLWRLDADRNKIKELPDSMAELENLQYLNLGGNPISDEQREKIRAMLPGCEIIF